MFWWLLSGVFSLLWIGSIALIEARSRRRKGVNQAERWVPYDRPGIADEVEWWLKGDP